MRLEVESCCGIVDLKRGVMGGMIALAILSCLQLILYITQPITLIGLVIIIIGSALVIFGIYKVRL